MQSDPSKNPLLERARDALRLSVCRRCYQRWPGRFIDPRSPRACEPTCTIFENLPQLLVAASDSHAGLTADEIAQRYVCITCLASVSSTAEFCGDRITRTCPLSRYAADVLAALDAVQ
jgi:ribosomal protein L40E